MAVANERSARRRVHRTFSLDPQVLAEVESRAWEERCSASRLVNQILQEAMERARRKERD